MSAGWRSANACCSHSPPDYIMIDETLPTTLDEILQRRANTRGDKSCLCIPVRQAAGKQLRGEQYLDLDTIDRLGATQRVRTRCDRTKRRGCKPTLRSTVARRGRRVIGLW